MGCAVSTMAGGGATSVLGDGELNVLGHGVAKSPLFLGDQPRDVELTSATTGLTFIPRATQHDDIACPQFPPAIVFKRIHLVSIASPGAEAWIASACTPAPSSLASVSLIMRWRWSRLFPLKASATI